MALCTATLHHHLRYERRGWVQPDVQPCPLRTTRNSSTAVRTCTACGGFDAAKDSDRSTAIQAKLYTVPVPYLQSSDGPGRLALSRVCDNCCEIYARPPVVWKGALSTMTRRLLAPNSPSSPSASAKSSARRLKSSNLNPTSQATSSPSGPFPVSGQGYAPSCSPFSYGCCQKVTCAPNTMRKLSEP